MRSKKQGRLGVRLDPRVRGDKGVKVFEKIGGREESACTFD